MKFIKSILLLNFQSWSKDSPELQLEQNIVNIIEGPNETGKSVFYKVMYNMVFPGYWSASELVRTGFRTGILIISLADGTKILYTLERSSYSITYYPSAGKEQKWISYRHCPQKVIEALGLVIDTNSKVILNIIDKDVPLPFVKTSPRFNASLIKAIVEPVSVTTLLCNLKEHMTEVDKATVAFAHEAGKYYAAYDALDYCNISLLEERKQKNDEALKVIDAFLAVFKQMTAIYEQTQNSPKSVKDPSCVEPLLRIYDMIAENISVLSNILTIFRNMPERVLDPAIAAYQLDVYDKICSVNHSLADIIKLREHIPRTVTAPQTADKAIAIYDRINNICLLLSKLIDKINAKPPIKKNFDLTKHFIILDKIICIQNILEDVEDKISLANSNKLKADSTLAEIKNMQMTYGVCPTCGRLLEEHT